MTKYNHTITDALHHAEIFENRSKRRAEVGLHEDAKDLDLWATALRLWVDCQHKITCWCCDSEMTLYVWKEQDGFCPKCAVEIELDEAKHEQ